MKLNQRQAETLVENYLHGQCDENLISVEIREIDSFGNDYEGSGIIELKVDHEDYFSEDLIGPTGTINCIEFIDKTVKETA